MSTVWITKEAWQTVTSALRNIVIRMDQTVQTPSVRFSGVGMSARIHIDLPSTGRSAAATSPVESSGYSGEFKVSVGEIVRNTEEEDNPGGIASLELFIRNGLALYVNDSNPPAGWITLAGKRVAKTPAYHYTFSQGGEYDLSNLYVWHRVVFETSIHSSFVFTNDDEMPDDETGSETTVYHLLAVIRDGKVIQAHYGPIHIMDRYYDETVTE